VDGLVWRGPNSGRLFAGATEIAHLRIQGDLSHTVICRVGGISHQVKSDFKEAPQMAFNDHAEHVRILSSVHKGIEGLRRRMQELEPELSTSMSEAVNVARRELCGSLVRRLVIAEKEIQELQDMLELNQKA
jgi:hypothetical protein